MIIDDIRPVCWRSFKPPRGRAGRAADKQRRKNSSAFFMNGNFDSGGAIEVLDQSGERRKVKVLGFTTSWPTVTAHLANGESAVLLLDAPEHGWVSPCAGGRNPRAARIAASSGAIHDCIDALQAIEALTRGTLSTHVHKIAVNVLASIQYPESGTQHPDLAAA